MQLHLHALSTNGRDDLRKQLLIAESALQGCPELSVLRQLLYIFAIIL